MRTEYHKIETPFERDIQGTKKLIEGKFRNPAVEALKDSTWVWTEKIDGTNVRVIWMDIKYLLEAVQMLLRCHHFYLIALMNTLEE